MATFSIKVQELDAGGKQYSFPLTHAWLDASLQGRAEHDLVLRPDPSFDGDLSLYAEKAGEDVVVRGKIRTRLLTECSRCLADAPIPVDIDVVALYTARGAGVRPVADADELTPEELDKEFYTGDTVVLDDLVRENVLLEVPMQPLCSESCEGLEVPPEIRGPADLTDAPVHEGKKVDPRLAPLLSLMNLGSLKDDGSLKNEGDAPAAPATEKKRSAPSSKKKKGH